jgi:DNA invertase Pin-like site-specific DNA recombinase
MWPARRQRAGCCCPTPMMMAASPAARWSVLPCKALLEDVDAGRVDQIVVYKIDRLTRSLADFAKIVDRLDRAGASFVSVTQSFNTATSMGRLTLNMLLSFAQFEREVTAERIRDKIAASKRKGLWMGGNVPLGYRAAGRTLEIDEGEARTIRQIYALYREDLSILSVRDRAADLGLRTRTRTAPDGKISGGGPFGRGHIHPAANARRPLHLRWLASSLMRPAIASRQVTAARMVIGCATMCRTAW